MGLNRSIIESFIAEKEAAGKARETLKKYRINLEQFSRAVGKRFEDWGKQEVIEALNWLNRQPFTPETKGKI